MSFLIFVLTMMNWEKLYVEKLEMNVKFYLENVEGMDDFGYWGVDGRIVFNSLIKMVKGNFALEQAYKWSKRIALLFL